MPISVRTSDLGLAAFFLVRGLEFVRADATTPRTEFELADPDGRAADLRDAYAADDTLAAFQDARKTLCRALWGARGSPRKMCDRADLGRPQFRRADPRRGDEG